MKSKTLYAGLALAMLLLCVSASYAQRVIYPPEEFTNRRQALCKAVGNDGLPYHRHYPYWPASGKFDELQEKAYRCVLEPQKAIIAAMKPGVKREETREICKKIYEKWGFGDQRPGGAGHFVGMSVHDVGDYIRHLEPGMVIAVEPIIEIKEKQLHIRIEDTVLVTEDGPEVLTKHVPKEVDEVLALVGSRKVTGNQ